MPDRVDAGIVCADGGAGDPRFDVKPRHSGGFAAMRAQGSRVERNAPFRGLTREGTRQSIHFRAAAATARGHALLPTRECKFGHIWQGLPFGLGHRSRPGRSDIPGQTRPVSYEELVLDTGAR
jgi:hypothetical protein